MRGLSFDELVRWMIEDASLNRSPKRSRKVRRAQRRSSHVHRPRARLSRGRPVAAVLRRCAHLAASASFASGSPRGAGVAAPRFAVLRPGSRGCIGAVQGGHHRRLMAGGCTMRGVRAAPRGRLSHHRRSRSAAEAPSHRARRFSPLPASPTAARCCSSTPRPCATRLKANPWIADATILKLLSRPAADRHHRAPAPSRCGRRTAGSA